jgi:putative protein-disulfide isomerase
MDKPTLVYIYDALCGWCYGFSPVMKRLHETYRDQLHFDVLSGGMVMGSRVGPIGQVAPYIAWAYKQVEERTGVTFGEGFLKGVLEPGTAIFSSEKPGIALTVFKSERSDEAVSFAHDLQRAVYFEGLDLQADPTYAALVQPYGLEGTAFVEKLNDFRFKQKTYAEFQAVSKLGVTGFPTVLLLTPEKKYVLSRGYAPFEELDGRLRQVLGVAQPG